MATENQNFFKHFEDTFNLIFNVTDIATDISSYYGTWCVTSTSDLDIILLEKNTNPAFTGASLNVGEISINGTTIDVSIDQGDFSSLPVGDYYHELTIGATQDGSDSVVVASGTWTIKEDAFPHR